MRFSTAGGLLILATWFFLTSQRAGYRESGQVIFYLLTGGLTFFALTAGIRTTSDCLSEEKREGTLGLLFLTDLRGYDIIAGKLIANSLHIFYGMLAVLPILAVPLLMGGITGAEFARLALVLLNTLFFSLSAGMLASAWCRNARFSAALTWLIVTGIAAGVPILGWCEWMLRNGRGSFFIPFLVPSPGFSYATGLDRLFVTPIGKWFFWSVGTVHAMGWMFLLLASRAVRHSWQEKAAISNYSPSQTTSPVDANDETISRDTFRTRCLNQNAFFWLATRPKYRVIWSWLPSIFGAAVWLWGITKFQRDWLDTSTYIATAFLLGIVMKALIGSEAGRRILEDRRAGALELLLSTALTERDIVQGQYLALRRQFLWPLAVMGVALILMWIAGLSKLHGNDARMWFCVGLAMAIIFVADIVALFWLGLWKALASPNPRRAFGAAVAPILALPWVGVALIMTLIAFLPRDFQRWLRPDLVVWGLWFVLSLAIDIGYSIYARNQLLTAFRAAAAQPLSTRPSLWQRITGAR